MVKKISLDGGALGGKKNQQYGNFVVTQQILTALGKYDHHNQYYVYSFVPKPFKLNKNLTYQCLQPRLGWMKIRVSLAEWCKPKNYFIALNQALPGSTPAKIIALSHGLAPLYYPELYPDSAGKLFKQTETILNKAKYIIVSSKAVKNSFNDIFKLKEEKLKKIKVIPFGIPEQYLKTKPKSQRKKQLIHVSMSHPIKNIPFILKVFTQLTNLVDFKDYKLIMIGITSEDLKRTEIPAIAKKRIVCHPYLQHKNLVKYYQESACLLTASLYESFNFPVLEALSQKTPVLGTETAVIPELRPFVQIVPNSLPTYLRALQKILRQPPNIPLKQIKKQFSWQHFCQQLIKLYE